jgi:hypothetical protein
MADYNAMYKRLFNAVTDAERLISQAADILKKVQEKTEEMYVAAPDPKILLLDKTDKGEDDNKD